MTGFKSSPEVLDEAARLVATDSPENWKQAGKGAREAASIMAERAAPPIAAEAFRAGAIAGREQALEEAREAIEKLSRQRPIANAPGLVLDAEGVCINRQAALAALAVLGERNEEENK